MVDDMMPQGMLDPDSFRIVILRRIHVAIVFGDKVGHVLFDAVWFLKAMFSRSGQIVEGVDVLKNSLPGKFLTPPVCRVGSAFLPGHWFAHRITSSGDSLILTPQRMIEGWLKSLLIIASTFLKYSL